MAHSQASSSGDESLKDWTLIDDEGGSFKGHGNKKRKSSSLNLVDIDVTSADLNPTPSSSRSSQSDIVIGSTSRVAVEKTDKDPVSDSDLDFVRIDDETDDHIDEWVQTSFVEQRRESLRVIPNRVSAEVDDLEDLSSDCTGIDSDEETSSVSNEDQDEDSSVVVVEELPADYPQGYQSSIQLYNHTRNARVNDSLTTLVFIAVAVLSGILLGHFIATEQFDGINQDATNSKVPEHHQYFDDPSKLVLSDVQKGQVEILRQLQEMIHLQGDLKHRIVSLEDENRDLRLRLMESRKRCTRILHKTPATLLPTGESNGDVISNSTREEGGDPFVPLVPIPSRSSVMADYPRTFRRKHVSLIRSTSVLAMPSTIAAVVVPPKLPQEMISTVFPIPASLSTAMPSDVAENAAHMVTSIRKYDPYYYALLNLDEISRATKVVSVAAPQNGADFVMIEDTVVPLEDLVIKRRSTNVSKAAPSSACTLPKNGRLSVASLDAIYYAKVDMEKLNRLEEKVQVEPITRDSRTEFKSKKSKFSESRKKFQSEYADFKARWKNTSADNNLKKESKKLKDQTKEKCLGGEFKYSDDGYCFVKPYKYGKYDVKERGSGKRFWDSLPPAIRKHFPKSAKLERILRGLGDDIVKSKVFQKVVEEVPRRLKTSSEWWGCQWNWWHNYAKNNQQSMYGDCAGYLTSWQNRYQQNKIRYSRDECKLSSKENKSERTWIEEEIEEAPFKRHEPPSVNWFMQRALLREEQRSPVDWFLQRASSRERMRSAIKYPLSHHLQNCTSWWFFERARVRRERRVSPIHDIARDVHEDIGGSIPGDPIYSFLKHHAGAMKHGSFNYP